MVRDSRRLDEVLDSPIEPRFQPIVDLDSMTVVGYEALARWPSAPDATPSDVFDHARRHGRLGDLDWACRRAAVVAALDGRLTQPMSVFINVEPTTLSLSPRWPFPGERFREITEHDLRIVVEITERNLLVDPAAVLAAVDWARDRGCGIALDDVGLNPESLALLPLVLPDVVKFDRRILSEPWSPGFDDTVSAVVDYASATGATILAEGIEHADDLGVARAVGATLGQGYLLGRPGPVPTDSAAPPDHLAIPLIEVLTEPLTNPADVLARMPQQISTYGTIANVLDTINSFGEDLITPGCVVVAVQNRSSFVDRYAFRYEDLAAKHTLVGVLGAPDLNVPGVRVAGPDDPGFDDQFAVAILTQTTAAAIVARDLGDSGPLAQRRYAWYFTHSRSAVRDVARCLVSRLAPNDDPSLR
ncbi:EAL domain-containing protein [Williamsia sp.]|uniref:sensor domain-containing phosphodiesterase n=1 Tax=Williamsia sp. TaxID=1872085 RepID=UPI001A2E1769|nr:EAL domain-containing protein [Williamsia sp.]MBJ7291418.1 EAL domain-containing protein [Williamsia sp.]